MRHLIAVTSLLCGIAVLPRVMSAVDPPETSTESLRDACREALSKLPVGEGLSRLTSREAREKLRTREYAQAHYDCKYFIAGSMETGDFPVVVSVSRGNGVVTEHSFCVPTGMPSDRLARVLVWWIDSNPEGLQESLEASLIDALDQAFPCEGPQAPDRAEHGARGSEPENQVLVPDWCPLCGSDEVLTIVYGLTDDLDGTSLWPGGCFSSEGSAKWHCAKCGHEWGWLGPRWF